jgi:outer membrane PBP1 activator LpoA protein
MDEKRILFEVQAAEKDVSEAEDALRTLLSTLESAARAEKTTVSAAVRAAFEKLSAARQRLGTVEALAQRPDD